MENKVEYKLMYMIVLIEVIFLNYWRNGFLEILERNRMVLRVELIMNIRYCVYFK